MSAHERQPCEFEPRSSILLSNSNSNSSMEASVQLSNSNFGSRTEVGSRAYDLSIYAMLLPAFMYQDLVKY